MNSHKRIISTINDIIAAINKNDNEMEDELAIQITISSAIYHDKSYGLIFKDMLKEIKKSFEPPLNAIKKLNLSEDFGFVKYLETYYSVFDAELKEEISLKGIPTAPMSDEDKKIIEKAFSFGLALNEKQSIDAKNNVPASEMSAFTEVPSEGNGILKNYELKSESLELFNNCEKFIDQLDKNEHAKCHAKATCEGEDLQEFSACVKNDCCCECEIEKDHEPCKEELHESK